MYTWNFQCLNPLATYDDQFVRSIHDVYLDAFGLQEGWSLEGIRKALLRSNVRGLLSSDYGEICGYAIYSVPALPLLGNSMIWEDAIALKKKIQNRKLSKQVIGHILSLFPERKFGWLGGRTQNPAVIKRYKKLGILFPFDISYSLHEGKAVMDYLLQNIEEVREVQALDKENGICRAIYRRRLGDYKTEISGTERFEEQLRKWDFDREKGDAVIVISKLHQVIQNSIEG